MNVVTPLSALHRDDRKQPAARWTENWHVDHAVSLRTSDYDHDAEMNRLRAKADTKTGIEFERLTSGTLSGNRFSQLLRTVDGLRELPRLEPLIDGVLDRGTLVVLHGAPKSFKTFVAIDIALSVATGSSWQGRSVSRSNVVYVAAEGQASFVDRVDAWTHPRSHLDVQGVRVLPTPLNLLDNVQVGEFAEAVADHAPGLIVIDTLARCMSDADENSSRDMGRVIAACDWLRNKLAVCIVLVHHDNRTGTNMRGSSALDGALDTSLAVRCSSKAITVSIDMAKHHESGARWRLAPTPAAKSLILVPHGSRGELPESHLDALQVLAASAGARSTGDWERACHVDADITPRTFARFKKELLRAGLTAERRQGRTVLCEVTTKGHAALAEDGRANE